MKPDIYTRIVSFPRKRESRPGFTIVEILIVITIFILIATFGLFLSMDFYRSYSFHSENSMAVSALLKARSKSLSNIDQTPHGVYVQNGKLKLFDGATYATKSASHQEITINPNTNISYTGASQEIVFDQLTGNVANTGILTLNNGFKTATTTINNEGRIDW